MSDAQAYYDGLTAQNYSPEQALQHTQQYFPDFQPAAAVAAPPPAPEPAREPALAPVPEPAVADVPAPAAATPMAGPPDAEASAAPAQMAGPPAAEAPAAPAPDAGGGGLVDMLFKFDGTIGRKEWWVCAIVTSIVVMVTAWLIRLIAGFTVDELSYLAFIPCLAMLWIFIALDVKRLRDRGKEGKMLVLPIIIIPWGFVECGFLPSKD